MGKSINTALLPIQYKYLSWNHTSFNMYLTLEHPASCRECCVIALLIWLWSWWVPWLPKHKNVSDCILSVAFASDDPLNRWCPGRGDVRWLSGFGDMNGFSITQCFGNVSCNWNLIFHKFPLAAIYRQCECCILVNGIWNKRFCWIILFFFPKRTLTARVWVLD